MPVLQSPRRLRLCLRCEVVEELIADGQPAGWIYDNENDEPIRAINRAVIQAARSLTHLNLTLTSSQADEVYR